MELPTSSAAAALAGSAGLTLPSVLCCVVAVRMPFPLATGLAGAIAALSWCKTFEALTAIEP